MRSLIFFGIALTCIAGGFLGYTIYSLPDVSELRETNPPTTAFIEYRRSQAASAGRRYVVDRRWASYQEIPLVLRRALVVAEDASFWIHDGFDWHEVEIAVEKNLEERKIVRGASTITQQTAKNLYLSPDRSIYRKLKEVLITRDLESELDKERILELYINCIEYGNGIFGMKSAALAYFGKLPAELSLAEMVRLVAVIPNPHNLRPNQPGNELRWRSRTILNRLRRYKFISYQDFQTAHAQLYEFFAQQTGE